MTNLWHLIVFKKKKNSCTHATRVFCLLCPTFSNTYKIYFSLEYLNLTMLMFNKIKSYFIYTFDVNSLTTFFSKD